MTQLFTHSLRQAYRQLRTDHLLQNSLYLMASTGVMAAFGFGFWLISARLYSPEAIGLGSTLIGITTMLGLGSLFGFDSAFVRFLPRSEHRSAVINTGLTITALGSALISLAFMLILPFVAPELHDLIETPLGGSLFAGALILSTVNTLTDSVFIALQQTKYILLADIGLSLVKVGLPLALIGLGAEGLFLSHAIGVAVATFISLVVIRRRFRTPLRPVISRPVLRQVQRYSAGTYLAGLSGAIPSLVLPIMVTVTLGAAAAAYFNLSLTIATLLYIVPRATGQSLFAAGSREDEPLGRHLTTTIRHTSLILLPAIIGLLGLGHFLLLAFGPSYAEGGSGILSILALAGLPLAIATILAVVLKIHHRLRELVAIEVVTAVVMLVLATPLMHSFGIAGAGWAWLAGQVIMAILLIVATAPLLWPNAKAKLSLGGTK